MDILVLVDFPLRNYFASGGLFLENEGNNLPVPLEEDKNIERLLNIAFI